MGLKNKIIALAVAEGGCEEGMRQLRSVGEDDKRGMVLTYLKNIDFCLSHNFPHNDFIRKNFTGVMNDYGILLDEKACLTNTRQVVSLGKTDCDVVVTGYNVSRVYAKHESVVRVNASGNAFVMVDVYDSAKVIINARGRANVCVNHHSGTFKQTTSDEASVKVRIKTEKTT